MDTKTTAHVFSRDIRENGRYVYTDPDSYANTRIARRKLCEINTFLRLHNTPVPTILDIGCGDGTYTEEYYRTFRPESMTAFDISEDAIRAARIRSKKHKLPIRYECMDISRASRVFIRHGFSLGILRETIHHLVDPEKSISELSKILRSVLVIEPNGANLILKIREKTSSYHRLHGEKSYTYGTINKWFTACGYTPRYRSYIGLIPVFSSPRVTDILSAIEPVIEKIPIVNSLACGTQVALFTMV